MVKVHDWLVRLSSDRGAPDSLWGTETVQAEEISILREYNVFLEFVPPNRTESAEIDSSPDPIDFFATVGVFGSAGVPFGVNRPRLLVEPVGDRAREEYGDDQTDEHFYSEENEAEEEGSIFPGGKSPNQGDVGHGSAFTAVLKLGVSVEVERKEKDGIRWWR